MCIRDSLLPSLPLSPPPSASGTELASSGLSRMGRAQYRAVTPYGTLPVPAYARPTRSPVLTYGMLVLTYAMVLHTPYAVCGTERGYAATLCYAVRGTERGYYATRRFVLSSGMLLPGLDWHAALDASWPTRYAYYHSVCVCTVIAYAFVLCFCTAITHAFVLPSRLRLYCHIACVFTAIKYAFVLPYRIRGIFLRTYRVTRCPSCVLLPASTLSWYAPVSAYATPTESPVLTSRMALRLYYQVEYAVQRAGVKKVSPDRLKVQRVSMGFDSGRISSRRKSTIKIITPPPRALRFLGPCRSMPLPPAYAMSGTELRIVLRVSYAISGTGVVCMVLTWRVEYGATRALCAVSY
eukprot:2692527-Rhodomonas_salina.2